MKFGFRIFAVGIVFLLLLPPVFSDSLLMKDGRNFPQVVVNDFVTGAPSGAFQIRMVTNAQLSRESYPVSEAEVQKIQFNPEGADASQSLGRTANLALTDGRKFDGVTVVSYEVSGEGAVFQIRQSGAAPNAPAYPVKSAGVSQIQFPPTAQPSPTPADDLSALMPGSARTEATETPGPTTTGTPATELERKMMKVMSNVEQEMKEKEKEQQEWRSLSGSQRMLKNLWNWLVSVLVSASIGGLVVYKTMNYKGEPVTWKKAFLTGILLATIPKFLLIACLYVPLCCLSLILGIVVWFLACRTIIMAVLDVQKPTAVTIIIVWFCLEVFIGIAIFFLKLGAFIAHIAVQ